MLEFCIPPEISSSKESVSSPNAEKVLQDSDKTDEKGNLADTTNASECDVKAEEINNPVSIAEKETSEICNEDEGDSNATNLRSGSNTAAEDKLPEKQESSAEVVDAETSKQGEQTESNNVNVKSEAMETDQLSDAPDNVPASVTADATTTDVPPEGGNSVATDSAMEVDDGEVASSGDHSIDKKSAGDATGNVEKEKCAEQETECQAADETKTPAEGNEAKNAGDKVEELAAKTTGGAGDQKDSAAVDELNHELNKEEASAVDGDEDKQKSDSKTSESLLNMLTSDEKKQTQGLL